MKKPEWWQIAIALYCAWNARDIVAAWRDAPYERGVWLCLAIWIVPIAVNLVIKRDVAPQPGLLVAALGVSVLGAIASANILNDAGLALAAIAWAPDSRLVRVWAPACILWMPVSGWLAHGFDPLPLLVIRTVVCTGISAMLVAALLRPSGIMKESL